MTAEAPVESLCGAVRSGDRREALEALRDTLAWSIEADAEVKSVAPLANQLRMVLSELDTLAEAKEGDPLDALAARRAARRSGTAAS